jgi:membrane dipeptidase
LFEAFMIRTFGFVAASALLMASGVAAQTAPTGTGEARVLEILKTTPLIDGHNDLPWALREKHGNDPYAVDLTTDLDASTGLHTDIPRLRAGGVGAQFWSVYVPATSRRPRRQGDLRTDRHGRRIVAAHPDVFELATTADDIERIHRRARSPA